MKLHKNQTHRSAGFTLIEIMAVVLIIGLLIAAVGGPIAQALFTGTETRVKNDLKQLESHIDLYRMKEREYPDSWDDLIQSEPPYIKKIPIDPWGEPYFYNPPQSGSDYEIGTWGADKTRGGEGEDADITNLTLEERDE